jgi:precorrin-6Y C5,15-methyltransferase (decarboxylating)
VREDRAARIRVNAAAFGLSHRIRVVNGNAPAALSDLEQPDAVFIGGGLDAAMFESVWSLLPTSARVVAHSVTLETESLLAELQLRHGGDLMCIEISRAAPLGRLRSWEATRPVVQWSVVKQGEGA